jgi:hypothetical protein
MKKMKSPDREPTRNNIGEKENKIEKKRLQYLWKPNCISVIIFASLLFTSIVACNPTRIVTSWTDPELETKAVRLNRFVVVALLKNQTVRKRTEDMMASYFPAKAVQSYKELGETELKQNIAFYDQKLKTEGFDGIIILRLLHLDKDKHYIPGNYPEYYRSWGFYYGAAWTDFYTPGHYAIDQIYEVEANVYYFKSNKLIWSATTSTVNPEGRDQLYEDVIKVVKKKMRKQGFLR